MKPEIMWAIVGVYGLYCGTWLRRKDAIDQHCRDKGATWRDCRKRGDRAVRVVVSLANAGAHRAAVADTVPTLVGKFGGGQ